MRWILPIAAVWLGEPASLAAEATRDLAPPTAAEIASQERIALVIGNAAYAEGPLANPENDAGAIAVSLKGLGFRVVRLVDQDEDEMRRAISDFGQAIQGADAALFFYGGHGLQVDGVNYMIPIGAMIDSEQDVEYEAVEIGRVLAEMEAAGAGVNLVFLDACRNNPFARSWRSAEQGLATMEAPSGTLIAYATAPGSVAADGAGTNSPYTAALIKAIHRPGEKVEDVLKEVRREVQEVSEGTQTPWESTSLIEDFYFLAPKGDPPGTLVVSAEFRGDVYLDGELVGQVARGDQLTLSGLAPGPHTVRVAGGDQELVEVLSQKQIEVYFPDPEAGLGGPTDPRAGRGMLAIGGGTALVAGGLWAGALAARGDYEDMVEQIAEVGFLEAGEDPVSAQRRTNRLGYAAQGALVVSAGAIGVGVALRW